MKSIRYNCRTPQCPNWMVLHEDQELLRDWTCDACQDALLTIQLDELERRNNARKPWANYGRDPQDNF